MNNPQVRGYRNPYRNLSPIDVGNFIEKIPHFTKIGGVCLITGKFVGLLAIPAAFIPSLNSIAIILVITWGALVFTSIALCSYEHFREKKVETEAEKMAYINQLISDNPTLREQLASTLEQNRDAKKYTIEEHYESQKVVHMAPKIHLRQP